MPKTEAWLYELVMRDANEDVFLVAVRQAIDTRFSRLVSGQLADLVKKAQKTGQFL